MPALSSRIAIVLSAVCSFVPAAHAVDARSEKMHDVLARSDAQLAWTLSIPLDFTSPIVAYRLADGILFGIGADGRARAIDAATGRFLWTVRVAPAGQQIWGPTGYRTGKTRAVVFSTFTEAIFVDIASGRTIQRLALPAPAVGPVAAYDNWVFSPSVKSRVWCVNVTSGHAEWELGGRGTIQVPPVYLPEDDLLVVADEAGYVHGSDSDRKRHYTERVGGRPRGTIAVDHTSIYIATAGDIPDVHSLDRKTGAANREPFRLNGRPEGGPTVTPASLYQSIVGGGVHRASLVPNSTSWFDPHASMFLAEWPERSVLLRLDGSIELVETATGRPLEVLQLGVQFRHAISSGSNDAVLVATDTGDIWCLRPAGAPPLTHESFHPTTQPTTRPVHTRPAHADRTVYSYAPSGGSHAARPSAAAGSPGAPPGAPPPPPPSSAGRPNPAGNEPRHSQRGRVADQLNKALGGPGR